MTKKYKAIGTGIIIFIIGVISVYSYFNGGEKSLAKNDNENMFVEENKEETLELKSKEIIVDVKGAVKNPNIYTLNEGSIVEDAIKAAGGITEEADLQRTNRAEVLNNNQEVIIPKKGNTSEDVETLAEVKDDKININKGTKEELETLKGIGPSKASAIIEYRETKGKFKTIEELKNVSGIGDGTFEKIKDRIKV